MKRTIIILILLVIGITVSHAQSATIQLPTIPNPGVPVIVPITITETENLDIVTTMTFIILFNPDVLEFTDLIFPNPNFPEDEWGSALPSPGDLRLIWFHTSAPGQTITPPEVLIEIEFEYFDGCSPLTWDTVTINGSGLNITLIDGSVGCAEQINLWEGTIDENWHNQDNWSFGIVPQGDDAEIPDTGSLYYPVIYESAETDSLFIHPNASLTIAPGGNLTTTGPFINDGTFLIQSDGSGMSGSFIDYGGMTGNGSFEFNRHITNSSLLYDPSAWHFISSPINGLNTNAITDYHVHLWNENNGSWQYIQGVEPCTPANPPVNLDPMEGWSIKLDPDYISNCGFGTGEIIEIQGSEFNSGVYSVTFSNSSGNAWAGWNLHGNPYPCSIDPGLISWPENLNQSIYLWDGRLNTYFTWAGGVGPESIPPTQGFFVNAFGDGTFTFSGDERIHDTENTWFKSEIENLLTLKAFNTENDYYDLTYIRFLEEATTGFDKEWDAYKLLSYTDGVPQIYTSTEDDILSINTKPTTVMVPLAFTSGQSGTFSIETIETSNLVFIILEDLFTGEQIDLLSGNYTFDFTAGDDPNRFVIYFTPVGTIENEENNIRIWSNSNNIIVSSENLLKRDIIIFDMIGKEIIRKPFKSNMNVIQVRQKNTLYIVEVLTANNKTVKKILVK